MNVSGLDHLARALEKPGYFVKILLNDRAAVFFPGTTEHRTVKQCGLSYEDEYRGNAMAGVITERRIEIRNHAEFSSGSVARIVSTLLALPQLSVLDGFRVTYHGQLIREGHVRDQRSEVRGQRTRRRI